MLQDIISKVITLRMDEIDKFNFPLNIPFGLEIIEEGIKYNFIIKLSDSNKNLIGFGAGAWPRNQVDSSGKLIEPPFMDRWSWYNYFEESCIAFADPIFFQDDNIRLGWYAGGKKWYLFVISRIIQKICGNQGIDFQDIVFFGSSGGGFASIALATLIRGSKAIVNNSSFSIRDISDGHYNDLINFMKTDFPNLNQSQIITIFNYRFFLVDLFKKMKYVPEITYFVNSNSKRDIIERCQPFVNEVIALPFFNNDLNIHYYSDDNDLWGGHGPMDTNITVEFIKLYCKTRLYSYDSNFNLLENYNELKLKNEKLNKFYTQVISQLKEINDSY